LPFIWRKYSSPEEAGWSSTKLEMVNEYTTNLGSIVVMVVYKDRALISLGDIEKKS